MLRHVDDSVVLTTSDLLVPYGQPTSRGQAVCTSSRKRSAEGRRGLHEAALHYEIGGRRGVNEYPIYYEN